MAASSAGAVKALIESLGLSLTAFRDSAPENQAFPYCTIDEAQDITPDLSGDNGTSASVTESVTVNLWQQHRHPTTRAITESYTLPDALAQGLHGGRLDSHPKKVYGVLVRSMVRLPELETNIVRHTIEADVKRLL